MPNILNKHFTTGDSNSVYIGRPSKWGNPWVIGKDGPRYQCIENYRKYLLSNKPLLADLPELRGKDLLCWCAPKRCHGEVLIEVLNNLHPALIINH